jgi:predicted LPLAT superfamily acyltransferase
MMADDRPPPAQGWAQRRERGSLLALRLMAFVAVTLGRPVARLLLPPICMYFLLAVPSARRHSARYLGRALGRPARWPDLYRHVHTFAAVVLDRVYLVRGQQHALHLQLHGDDGCAETIAAGQGGFLIGAHFGSFEALHTAGKSFPGMQVTMVMYPDNANKIHGVLQALAPEFKLAVIGIGNPGSTLAIRAALQQGRLVGLLGDRQPPAQSAGGAAGVAGAPASARGKSLLIPFLGVPASFSDGPFRLALLLRQRVIFMAGVYLGGDRYDVRFETLADFRNIPADAATREAVMHNALRLYVQRLEGLCREAPYNWFNFYDYWAEDEATAPAAHTVAVAPRSEPLSSRHDAPV